MGGDLESYRQNRLGKMGMSSPRQTEEMAGCGLGRWFDMSGKILLDRQGWLCVLRDWPLDLA